MTALSRPLLPTFSDSTIQSIELLMGGSCKEHRLADLTRFSFSMSLSVASSSSPQKLGRQGYLLLTDHSFSEFTYAVYTPGYESDLILIPKSLLFEAATVTDERLPKVVVRGMKPGAHVRVFFDEDKFVNGFGPTGKFSCGDIRDCNGVECVDGSREGQHQLKTYCAFSRDDPAAPLPRPPPRCGTSHFGEVPMVDGINPRDYDPYVFFHCRVRYEIQLHEVNGDPSKLPTASIKLVLEKVVEPVWEHKKLDLLYLGIMGRCGWPIPRRPDLMPSTFEEEVKMKKIELTGAYPSLPPAISRAVLYYLEGGRILYPKNPRQKVVMGMMTRAPFCRGGARYLQGPVVDGGKITSSLIYYELERFYVVFNYQVHHEPESWIPVRPSIMFGENEYRIKIYAPEKFPGFYAGVSFGSILIEDPFDLLFGRRIPPGEAIYVWTQPNDHERVAKLRICALETSSVLPTEPIQGTGFLVNPRTGSFYCAEHPRQRIYLTERLLEGVEVGEFITFKASYNIEERRHTVDEWRKAMKPRMQVDYAGSKHIFKDRLLATRLVISKKCVRAETLGLVTDKEDLIYKWCFDKNAEMPDKGTVHAYVEENTDPDRCTFFNIHSFDWELRCVGKTPQSLSAAYDRRPDNDPEEMRPKNYSMRTGWAKQATPDDGCSSSSAADVVAGRR